MNKKWLWNTLRFIFVVAIFGYLYKSGQLDFSTLKGVLVRPGLFAIAIVFLFTGALISVERWRILLQAHNHPIRFGTATKLTFIGFFFSTAIPGSVSGDIIKAYYLTRGQEQKTRLVTTIVFDRLLGLYTMVMVAVISVLLTYTNYRTNGSMDFWIQPSIKMLGISILLFFLFLTIIGIIFMSKKLRQSRLVEYILTRMPFHKTVTNIYDAVHHYGHKTGLTIRAIIVSLISQIPLFIGIWCLSEVLNIELESFISYLFALPVCMLINSIPIAPGGLGVGEAGFQGIFLLFGSDKGAALAVLFHVVFFILAIGFGGMIYLFSDVSRSKINPKT